MRPETSEGHTTWHKHAFLVTDLGLWLVDIWGLNNFRGLGGNIGSISEQRSREYMAWSSVGHERAPNHASGVEMAIYSLHFWAKEQRRYGSEFSRPWKGIHTMICQSLTNEFLSEANILDLQSPLLEYKKGVEVQYYSALERKEKVPKVRYSPIPT